MLTRLYLIVYVYLWMNIDSDDQNQRYKSQIQPSMSFVKLVAMDKYLIGFYCVSIKSCEHMFRQFWSHCRTDLSTVSMVY